MAKTALHTYRSSPGGRIEDTTDYGWEERIITSVIAVPSDWNPQSPSWERHMEKMKEFAVSKLAENEDMYFTGQPFSLEKNGVSKLFKSGLAISGPFPYYEESKSDLLGLIANQVEYDFFQDETGNWHSKPKQQELVTYRLRGVYRARRYKQEIVLIHGQRHNPFVQIPAGWYLKDGRIYDQTLPEIPLILGIGAQPWLEP